MANVFALRSPLSAADRRPARWYLRQSRHPLRQQKIAQAPKIQRKRRKLAATVATAVPAAATSDPKARASTVIVGGGPCGLAAAMYLSQMGWSNIEVWDKLPRPKPSDAGLWGNSHRFYNNVIKGKGQAVLHEIGAYDRVVSCCAPDAYRQEWSPQNPDGKRVWHEPTKENPMPQVIQRDRLVACMLEHIEEAHAGRVRVRHSMQLQELSVQAGGKVSLKWSQGDPPAAEAAGKEAVQSEGTTETAFVVGADGANSAVRTLLEEQGLGEVRSVQMEEKRKNTRMLKTVVMPVKGTEYAAPDGSGMCRISERSASGRVFESQPTKEGTQIGQIFFNVDDEEVKSIATEEEAAAFLQREFPNIFPLIPRSEVAAFPQRPPSKVQTFQYVWPDLHYSDSVVLAGDAVHTVKPYFGLGLNGALDDVRWLSQCLEKHPDDRAAALALYSKERALDGQAMVVESHKADQSLVQLLLPTIMDSIFTKLFPGLFRTTMFKSMSMAGVRFSAVRRRKRLDRTVQFTMIGASAGMLCVAVSSVLS